MSKKTKFFIGVGVVAALMILFKIQLIISKNFYFIEAWVENLIIYMSIAILLGGFVEFLTNKIKGYKILIIHIATLLIGVSSYYLQVGWLYMVNLRWIEESEIENFIYSIKTSEIPWLFMITTVATFLVTYLVMQRYPRLINPAVTNDVTIREDIDVNKVQFKEYAFNSTIAKNMMCLHDYDYFEQKDLGFLNCQWNIQRANNDTDKFFAAEYDGQPMGYFIVRNNGGDNYEITEFYASHFVDMSFRTLYQAMKKYLGTLNKAYMRVKNVGCMETATANLIELIIKDCTEANYELISTGKTNERTNYDICFKL